MTRIITIPDDLDREIREFADVHTGGDADGMILLALMRSLRPEAFQQMIEQRGAAADGWAPVAEVVA